MAALSFDHPAWLLALWLLVPWALLLARAQRRRRVVAARFVAPALHDELLPRLDGARPWWAIALQLLGAACLCFASAGPRLGVTFEPTRERGADLLVVLDVSKSMLSADVAPSRLERAKSDVRDLVAQLAGHRLGLLLFAGRAASACPLTTDRAFFLDALAKAGPGSAPRGGTAIGDALRAALQALPAERERDQAIVLITDGEDHDSFPLEAAKQAAERGVRVFTVGLGDPDEGARVPAAANDGTSAYLKHEGQEIWSKLQEGLLTEIATTTGGAYVPARTTTYDLGVLYRDHLEKLAAGDFGTTRRQRRTPRFQWFLAASLACFAAARWLREAKGRPAWRPALAAAPLLAIAALAPVARADEPTRAVRVEAAAAVADGIARLAAGDAQESLAKFDRAAELLKGDAVVLFDRGCARRAGGDLDGAAADFAVPAAGRDLALAAKARFNLGDVAVARAQQSLGEKPEEAEGDARTKAVDAIEAAIGHYRSCLAVAPDHAGARANLERLRLWLKQMADAWARHDREKRREELDLLKFLDWLFTQEGELRTAGRGVARESDSPLRRAAQEALARRQRSLVEELPTLKEKLARAVQDAAQQAAAPAAAQNGAPGGAPPQGAPAPDPAQLEALVRSLAEAVDAIGGEMTRAGDAFAAAKFADGDLAGSHAQQGFEQLWLTFSDFGSVVQRGLGVANAQVDALKPFAAPDADPPFAAADEARTTTREQARRIATIGALLPSHAEAMKEQQEFAAAVAKAIESGPKIEAAARTAATQVDLPDAATALGAAEEAQRLLKEIADLLPKQEPKEDEKKDDENKKDEQKQDKPDEKNQDDGKKPDEKSQEPQDPGDPQQQKDDPSTSPEQKRSQAQALLRKALERAKEKAAEQKKVEEALLVVPGGVDRDW